MIEERVEAKLFKKIDNTYVEITKEQLIISLQEANKSLEQENKQLKEMLQEIYERAINTNITSLDFRDYILEILGDKE